MLYALDDSFLECGGIDPHSSGPPLVGKGALEEALSSDIPMRFKLHRDETRIVRPVLEKRTLFFEALAQTARAIVVPSSAQCQVMGSF